MNERTTRQTTSVLITGANNGLGFEAARRLGEQVGRSSSARVIKVEDEQPLTS
jgi:NAD(P)-dependent dehydrogenase (short-subunit alcohol dehydrogenase family)